jgi:hypothetical protein
LIQHKLLGRSEDDDRSMGLDLDLAFGSEARANQRLGDSLAGSRLAEQEKRVVRTTPDDERRDDPGLRREKQRLARAADVELLDLVRDHPVQVRGGVGPLHENVRPRPGRGV